MGAAKVLDYGRTRVRAARDFTRTMGGKVTTAAAGVSGAATMATVKMFAADEVTTSISTAMDSLKSQALIALGSVAAVGIVLFAGPYVWRYAKRVFKTVAS